MLYVFLFLTLFCAIVNGWIITEVSFAYIENNKDHIAWRWRYFLTLIAICLQLVGIYFAYRAYGGM